MQGGPRGEGKGSGGGGAGRVTEGALWYSISTPTAATPDGHAEECYANRT